MKPLCRLLGLYTFIVIFFVVLFASVIYFTQPAKADVFSMVLSIAMFALIPFGIIFILWKHHRH
ncbi:MAG: hypothetical protein QXK08_04155 [Candidatus Woesearchaeota archaeon]